MKKDYVDLNRRANEWQFIEKRAVQLGPEMLAYFNYHRKRYEILLGVVQEFVAIRQKNKPVRLLDIGFGFQTLLFDRLWPKHELNTLGWKSDQFTLENKRKHIEFDLNDSLFPEKWPKDSEGYDIIIMAEVVEHLYTAPVQVLRCLGSLLAPGGYLIVTTPNAVALQNRLRLLLGRNPYEMIRESRNNPGHFREYTAPELVQSGNDAGLQIARIIAGHFCSTQSVASRLLHAITPLLSCSLRKELIVVYQRQQ